MSRCSRCRAGISASELVMRARDLVYHVACFTCASCGTPLNKGDHFGQRDGLVYCRWETGVSDHYYPSKAASPCYQRVRWRDINRSTRSFVASRHSFLRLPYLRANDGCWVLMMVIGTDEFGFGFREHDRDDRYRGTWEWECQDLWGVSWFLQTFTKWNIPRALWNTYDNRKVPR